MISINSMGYSLVPSLMRVPKSLKFFIQNLNVSVFSQQTFKSNGKKGVLIKQESRFPLPYVLSFKCSKTGSYKRSLNDTYVAPSLFLLKELFNNQSS